MATITRTVSGTWKALVRKHGWPQQIRTFRLKIDATDWARGVEDEMARGVYRTVPATSAKLTVSVALDRYLREITPTKAPGTQRSEHTHSTPLKANLGGWALAGLTPEAVAAYRDQRIKTVSVRTGRKITASTVRGELALLSNLFTIAGQEWNCGVKWNPVQVIRKPKSHPGRTRRLTPNEETPLLAACDRHSNPMFATIVRMALYTAMRQGEIVSLTQDQVNLERRTITLPRTKNQSARTVPLSTAAVKVLAAAIANPMRSGSTLVFPGEPGRDGMRRPYIFNGIWQTVVEAAGLSDFHFHDLRHEAVSRLVELGLSDQEVAAVSGHKSMQMLKRYTHLRAEDLVAKLG